jgi:protein TonB
VVFDYHYQQKNLLLWTFLISIVLHAVGIYFIPNIEFTPEVEPKILVVELAPPPPPKKLVTPEPPKPTKPVKQEPIKPPPVKQEPPKQETVKEEPIKPIVHKAAESIPEKAPEPHPVKEPPPNIIAVPAKVENPAPVVVPAPAPPTPVELPKPAPQPRVDIDGLSSQYAKLISKEVAKYKQYPRIAQMRNWQGEALIQILVDANGKVLDSKIHTSSGYEVLDKQALKMVAEATLPLPPEALRNKPISIIIPISFKLE